MFVSNCPFPISKTYLIAEGKHRTAFRASTSSEDCAYFTSYPLKHLAHLIRSGRPNCTAVFDTVSITMHMVVEWSVAHSIPPHMSESRVPLLEESCSALQLTRLGRKIAAIEYQPPEMHHREGVSG
jgi:hypothetical protein